MSEPNCSTNESPDESKPFLPFSTPNRSLGLFGVPQISLFNPQFQPPAVNSAANYAAFLQLQQLAALNLLFHNTLSQIANGTTHSEANKGVSKSSRGRRGQYRRYEKSALENAMRAVSGGMSVHKAGSKFGVPHSTLEYKLKNQLRRTQTKQTTTTTKSEEEPSGNVEMEPETTSNQSLPVSCSNT
ncbi:HTH psq-type domain-containing protein [Aphelenchoides besseyi]|nr:HTH psq-type domain-containing protein [Aphelenchoides besseyi]KAI6229398.1 HTH psq-type domain-containing protein [Aphelenchoides besseyi]